ncbi:putative weak: protein [Treponema primitia ZAS-2]|uniref:Putative weak: protein n=1 Tax=Treponema primitia (strain ATCC BAA-887 / DSM 12427 / ZAS-2) TaxID=545694 RepID=F5YJV1_TREPZ|nr:DUF6884 domain-containing protein [Treponema primitia]AEF86110.1 putative weak: protein [Treponema primitia ZAS-2]
MKIVLLSCVKTQNNYKTKAKYLYHGSYFEKAYEYANILKPDRIFIISSKYGVLESDDEIEPYNVELRSKSISDRKLWSKNIIEQLETKCDINNDKFIILAFDKYIELFIDKINNKEIPMSGLPIGKKLKWLNKELYKA